METRVCRLYGQHDLRIETADVPQPGPGEVLVAIGAGGICGSDLHYFQDGGFGPIRVREPIILGHEIAGTIAALGEGVTSLNVGQKVAVNPSRPCRSCKYCTEGLFAHCLAMRFMGSALRFPHEQGGFRDLVVTDAIQCEPVGAHVDHAEAACAEPLAVCLHAANQAGPLEGRHVLITGAGPIGLLCLAAARRAGATSITVTDLQDATLAVAAQMGATQTINVMTQPEVLEPFKADKGHFNVVFECSAAAPALRTAIECVRPRGRIVQVGVTGDLPIPVNLIVGKEIEFVGTHRFHEEYALAARLIDSGEIDVKPVISHRFALDDAEEAFRIAGDRSQAIKVSLTFASA